MSKLNSLEQNNNKDTEDDACSWWGKIAFKKKKSYVISNSEVRPGGIFAFKQLLKYRSTITSSPSSPMLSHYFTDISLNLPGSPKQKSNSGCLSTVWFSICSILWAPSQHFFEKYICQKKNSQQRSHILISLDFIARCQMLLKLPK